MIPKMLLHTLAAGYLLMAVLTLRLGAGAAVGRGHALQLPRPGRLGDLARRPWTAMPWLTVLLLGAIAISGVTGIYADQVPSRLVGHLHEALGEAAMYAALAHILFAGALWLRGRFSTSRPLRRSP